MFDQKMYRVPEDNRTAVLLCIDVGVELPERTEFIVSAKTKDPPNATS